MFTAEVAGLIGFAAEPERCGAVVDGACGCVDGRAAGYCGVESGCINKRFEYRPGGPLRKDSIELASFIVAPAHKRLDLARPRIERNQRDLRLVARLAGALRQQLVNILHS